MSITADRLRKYVELSAKDRFRMQKIDEHTHQIVRNGGINDGQSKGLIHKMRDGKHTVWLPKNPAHLTKHSTPQHAIDYVNKSTVKIKHPKTKEPTNV